MELLKKLENLSIEDDCVWGGGDGLKLVAQFFDVEPNQCAIFFAAAPEMYEALERLFRIASVELKGKRDDVLGQAQMALLKAEGREV